MSNFYRAKIALPLLITLVLTVSFSLSAQANLLSNPGFESPEGDGLQPDYWSFTGVAPYATGRISILYAHSGNQSVTTQLGVPTGTITGYWKQRVTGINPGDPVEANIWAKITRMDGDSIRAELGLAFQRSGQETYYVFSDPLTTIQDWTKLSVSSIAPSDTEAVEIWASSTAVHGGKIYFDDADLSVVPEPASLLLLGSGLVGMFVASRRKR